LEVTKRYETTLVSMFFVAWGSVFLDRTAELYLAPYFAPQFHINSTQIGMLASATSITWAISCLLFGALSDRIGRRAILIQSTFAFSVFSWISGLAQNFDQLLLIRAVMGIAGGAFFAVMSTILEESSPPTRRGRNVGIVVSAASLVGWAVSPILATQIAAHYSWRWAFFAAGVPGVIIGFLMWKFVKEPERHAEGSGHAQAKTKLADYFQVLRYRNMWLAAFAAAGTIGWLFLQNVFAPIYITKVLHQPGTTAGLLLGASGLGSFVLGFIFPAISDRIGRKETLLILAALSTVVPIAMYIPALYNHLWLLAAILFLANGHQAILALVLVLVPTESVPRGLAGTAVGLSTLVGELFGATLMPTLGGALAVRYGLGFTLWMSAGGTALVFLLALFLKKSGSPELGVPAPHAAVAG